MAEGEPFWREIMRALIHNAGLFANDVPHIDQVQLKRELRRNIKAGRKILAIVENNDRVHAERMATVTQRREERSAT